MLASLAVVACATPIPEAGESIILLPGRMAILGVDGERYRPQVRQSLSVHEGHHILLFRVWGRYHGGGFRADYAVTCQVAATLATGVYEPDFQLEKAKRGGLLVNPAYLLRLLDVESGETVGACSGQIQPPSSLPPHEDISSQSAKDPRAAA